MPATRNNTVGGFKYQHAWPLWTHETKTHELVYKAKDYRVDLDRCKTAAAVLDWIMQVAGKSWATPEIVGQLCFAIDEVLDPQAKLCSWALTMPSNAAHEM